MLHHLINEAEIVNQPRTGGWFSVFLCVCLCVFLCVCVYMCVLMCMYVCVCVCVHRRRSRGDGGDLRPCVCVAVMYLVSWKRYSRPKEGQTLKHEVYYATHTHSPHPPTHTHTHTQPH